MEFETPAGPSGPGARMKELNKNLNPDGQGGSVDEGDPLDFSQLKHHKDHRFTFPANMDFLLLSKALDS